MSSVMGYLLIVSLVSSVNSRETRRRFVLIKQITNKLEQSQEVLSYLLPAFVRSRVKDGVRYISEKQGQVTIIFCNICNFDQICNQLSSEELLQFLDTIFYQFDKLCEKIGVTKIETVGKTYLACAGLNDSENEFEATTQVIPYAVRAVEFAFSMIRAISQMRSVRDEPVTVKIGIHTGPVRAGVVGYHKPQFSLVGDTVNTASRMCSTITTPNSIQISEDTYRIIRQYYDLDVPALQIPVKGKGMMTTYIIYSAEQGDESDHESVQVCSDSDAEQIVTPQNSTENVQRRSDSADPVAAPSGIPKLMIFDYDGVSDNSEDDDDFSDTKRKQSINSQTFGNKFYNVNAMKKIDQLPKLKYSHLQHVKRQASEIIKEHIVEEQEQVILKTQKERIQQSFELVSQYDDVTRSIWAQTDPLQALYTGKNESLKWIRWVGMLISILINVTILLCYLIFEVEEQLLIFHRFLFTLQLGCLLNTHKFIQLRPILYITTLIYGISMCLMQLVSTSVEYHGLILIELVIYSTLLNLGSRLSYKANFIILVTIIIGLSLGLFISSCEFYQFQQLLVVISTMFLNWALVVFFKQGFGINHQLKQKMQEEIQKTDDLVSNLLPSHVIDNLKNGQAKADTIEMATVLFADIVGFTQWSADKRPEEVIDMLSNLFTRFDRLCVQYNIYKVHTIGDCYVAMTYPNSNTSKSKQGCYNIYQFAMDMIQCIKAVNEENSIHLNMRIGIHTGNIIAGITGSTIVRYDIYGPDALIANKMESLGIAGRIHVSEMTKYLLEDYIGHNKFEPNRKFYIPSIGQKVKGYFIKENQIYDNNYTHQSAFLIAFINSASFSLYCFFTTVTFFSNSPHLFLQRYNISLYVWPLANSLSNYPILSLSECKIYSESSTEL